MCIYRGFVISHPRKHWASHYLAWEQTTLLTCAPRCGTSRVICSCWQAGVRSRIQIGHTWLLPGQMRPPSIAPMWIFWAIDGSSPLSFSPLMKPAGRILPSYSPPLIPLPLLFPLPSFPSLSSLLFSSLDMLSFAACHFHFHLSLFPFSIIF